MKHLTISTLIVVCFTVICYSQDTLTAKKESHKSEFNPNDYYRQKSDISKVTYEGGDGKTKENAIIIKNAQNERNGIAAEYALIGKIYGVRNVDWKQKEQSTTRKDNKRYDIITVELTRIKETITLYFDITDFFGKL